MKKQMNFIDVAVPTMIMGVLMVIMLAAISYSGDLFSSSLLSLPSVNQNLEEQGLLQNRSMVSGTPEFVNEALQGQYAPIAVAAASNGTPQFVNEALQGQYAPVAVAAASNGTPQFVNEVLQGQYAPVAVAAASNGTPQFVNEALQAQYTPNQL